MILTGLVFVVGVPVNKHRLEAKRDRLHATGVAVTATIVGTRNSKGPKMHLAYEADGRRYSQWIPCGARTPRCEGGIGHAVLIRIDRNKPAEFVAANGHTDNDIDLLDNWGIVGLGIVLALLGGVGAAIEWPRPEPVRRRRGRPVSR